MKDSQMKKLFGEMLLEEGVITDIQLAMALCNQEFSRMKLGFELLKKGFINEAKLAIAINKQTGLEIISLDEIEVSENALDCLPAEIAITYEVFPIKCTGKKLTLAIADPMDKKTLDTIAGKTGKKIEPALAIGSEIRDAIDRHYKTADVKREAGFWKIDETTSEERLDKLVRLLISKKLISRDELLNTDK